MIARNGADPVIPDEYVAERCGLRIAPRRPPVFAPRMEARS
jgi:hypothetical protein